MSVSLPDHGDVEPFMPIEAYLDHAPDKSRVTSLAAHSKRKIVEATSDVVEPLTVEPASLLAERDPPPPRDSIIQDIALNAGRLAIMLGNGGMGKSTIAHQIAMHVATNTSLWGMEVRGGPVLGIFCEDERDELERKTRSIATAEGIDLELLDSLFLLSRDGDDNALCSFDRGLIMPTPFYRSLDATVALIKPRLTILDTAADMFAGDFMSTPQVRQFLKVVLGGLCARHGTAVLLLAHPSANAMANGDGAGFSVAWNNSVRSRLYLRRPKSDDADAIADRRILETRKSNYGPTGGTVPLIYCNGRFVLDPSPIEEGVKPKKAVKVDTRLSLAVMGYFNDHAASGQVARFGDVFEHLQKAGDIPPGDYEKLRKALQRTLGTLVQESLLFSSKGPKGYRMVQESGQ
jgi:RecA-family ATPase